ncbi:MAG: hypothetical protein E7172_05570 [Firmicutes bacterium]|nr:hypothetical protein [Bacillota bacterium]
MYNVLLSEYEKGMQLVDSKLRKIIKGDEKAVIIAWTFPFELEKKSFEEEWFPKNGRRYNKYVGSLLNLGIKEENIIVLNCYDKENFKNFKQIIDDSDILVITGGNPEMLYSKVTQETEILYNIKHYKGIIIGFSAGADLQLKRYFITAKNNYYKYFAFYDGFGVLDDPFYLDVHSINNKRYLDKLQKISNEKKKNVYAIFDDGAMIYDRVSNNLELFGNVLTFEPKE